MRAKTPSAAAGESGSTSMTWEPILPRSVTRQLIAHIGDTGADARRQRTRALLARLSERERELPSRWDGADQTRRSAANCS